MQLASARAVVTGGVSGLGFAVAQHLVKHGGKVALFDVNDDKGAAAVAELGEANARYFRTDVTDEAGVAANVAAARDFLGGLNVAVHAVPRAPEEAGAPSTGRSNRRERFRRRTCPGAVEAVRGPSGRRRNRPGRVR